MMIDERRVVDLDIVAPVDKNESIDELRQKFEEVQTHQLSQFYNNNSNLIRMAISNTTLTA
jgi:uncharacterized protein (DUF433 family)